jgi:hypothetical protein
MLMLSCLISVILNSSLFISWELNSSLFTQLANSQVKALNKY